MHIHVEELAMDRIQFLRLTESIELRRQSCCRRTIPSSEIEQRRVSTIAAMIESASHIACDMRTNSLANPRKVFVRGDSRRKLLQQKLGTGLAGSECREPT